MELNVLLLVILQTTAACLYVPSNKAVVAGHDVVMNCPYTESRPISRRWKFKEVNGEQETILSYESNISMADSHSISLNSSMLGQYGLHLSQANREHAGTYICILEEETRVTDKSSKIRRSERYEAYLAILTSEPKCSTTARDTNYTVTEGDIIEAQCSVVYFSVNNNLRMEWRREDGSIVNPKTNISYNTAGSYKVTSSITFNVTYEDNGLQLICYTYFTESNESNSTDPRLHRATNAPDYSHTYSIPQLNVQYMPRNVTILQYIRDISLPDDCYYCHAEGNPKPECKWTITSAKENISHSGCFLFIKEYKFSESDLIIECEVINKIGKISIGMKINVTGNFGIITTMKINATDCYSKDTIMVLSAIVALLLILLITSLTVHFMSKKRSFSIKHGNSLTGVQQQEIGISTLENTQEYEQITVQEPLSSIESRDYQSLNIETSTYVNYRSS